MPEHKPMTEEEIAEAEEQCRKRVEAQEVFERYVHTPQFIDDDEERGRYLDALDFIDNFSAIAMKGWPRTLAEVRRLRVERYTPSLTEINAEAQVVALKKKIEELEEKIEELETDYNMALSQIFTVCEAWDDDNDCAYNPGHTEVAAAVRRARQYLRAERRVAPERTLTLPNGTIVRAGDVLCHHDEDEDGVIVTAVGTQSFLACDRSTGHEYQYPNCGYNWRLWSEVYPDRPVPTINGE